MLRFSRLAHRVFAACLLGAAIGAAGVAQAEEPAAPILVVPAETGQAAGAEALVARAAAQGQVRVIIGLDEALADEETLAPAEVQTQRTRLRAAQSALLADLGAAAVPEQRRTGPGAGGHGVDGVTLFDTIPFLALNADAAAVRRLLAAPGVTSVQEDVPVPPTLLQSVPLIKADQAWALGFSGTGQVVAVLDSGVSKTHPMLTGKVVSEACYSSTVAGQSTSLCPGGAAASTAANSGVNCPTNVYGCDHGTHVASIAVGNASNIKGVARDAKLIAIKVFSRFDSPSSCGSLPAPCILAYYSDITKGLERVYTLRKAFKIASANMSIGGGAYSTACDKQLPATTAIIKKLRTAKIASVIASGNSGYNGFVGAPGCIAAAVTVGSTTKSDTLSSFSNQAKLVDLLAPRREHPGGGPGRRARHQERHVDGGAARRRRVRHPQAGQAGGKRGRTADGAHLHRQADRPRRHQQAADRRSRGVERRPLTGDGLQVKAGRHGG